jgi:hypothetical protein
VTKYLITVSKASRRGRKKLHTFGKLIEADHLRWTVETHVSRKQFKERHAPQSPLGVANWPPPERRDLGSPRYEELRNGPLHLDNGVDIAAGALTVVLDALRSDQRHEVDLADIKVVVSKHGSQIARLDGLDTETRRHAEAALYTLILRCCTRL